MSKYNVLLSEEVIEKMYNFRLNYYYQTSIWLANWDEVIEFMLTTFKDKNIL